MAHEFGFKPSVFSRSLEGIRLKFPLIDEIIYKKKAEDTARMVEQVSELDDDQLISFAEGLKNEDLDLPLAAFKSEEENGQGDKLESILRIRFRKKLFLLNWLILQNNYKNQKLKDSMETLCGIMKEKYPGEYSETIFAKIGSWGSEPVRNVMGLFKKEGTTLKEFFKKYQLLHKSKFSYVFFTEYFSKASKEEVLNDRQLFILAASSYIPAESAAVLERYISIFDIREYSDDIMDIITQKPSDEGIKFCDLISEEAKTKYRQWTRLKKMENHFGKDSNKYEFWSNYLEDIKDVQTADESRVIFIYFDTCVVVDMGEPEQHAYLYYNESFKIEYEHFMDPENGKKKVWRIFAGNVIDARDSVIEGKRSDIYKLSYEFVGRLYLREILHTEALRKRKHK